MKKWILFASFAICMSSSFGQDKGQDYITMQPDGKVCWIRSGQTIQLGISVPLKNGSTAYPNGVVKAKDGSSIQLKPGDRMLMDGTMVTKKKKK